MISLKVGQPNKTFLEMKRRDNMATVMIQRRERKNRNSYIVYFKDPATRERKYYRTFPRMKDAQKAANDLRTLIV
jgi:hypothetical protein